MIFDRHDLDRRTLERAEKEGLEQPSNSSMWDKRMYETHAATLTWAVNGSDLMEESNYLKVLEHLRDLAGEDADEHLIDASISDWAVGPLRQLFVQTRDAVTGDFTLAFQEVVAIAIALRDEYPVWDEADYSSRQFDRWQGTVLEELRYVATDEDDDALTEKLVDAAVTVLQEDGDLDYLGVPDRETLTDAYRRARDEHYTTLGTEHLSAQIEGQQSLAL